MKKILYVASIFFINIILLGNVKASTLTYNRTEEDLLITKDITITEYRKQDILNTPAVNAEEKIYDFAELFTEEEEKDLYNSIEKYIEKTSFDFALVTINENNKSSAMAYADDFYDYNSFGINSSNDGILFLIDMDTREIYMSTTGKAIEAYSDKEIDQLLDKVYIYMTDKEYYKGTNIFINASKEFALVDAYRHHYTIDSEGNIKKYTPWTIIFIIALIGTLIIMLIMVKLNRMVAKATSYREFLVKDTLEIQKIKDVLINTFTSKTRIETSSSGGGGHSSHSGGSGISHGGGGHRF